MVTLGTIISTLIIIPGNTLVFLPGYKLYIYTDQCSASTPKRWTKKKRGKTAGREIWASPRITAIFSPTLFRIEGRLVTKQRNRREKEILYFF